MIGFCIQMFSYLGVALVEKAEEVWLYSLGPFFRKPEELSATSQHCVCLCATMLIIDGTAETVSKTQSNAFLFVRVAEVTPVVIP